MCKATLYIPRSGYIPASRTKHLPDDLALIMGRIAAMTLSERDGKVIGEFSDGRKKAVWCDITGRIIVGW
jgi:hypothetical protein